MNSQRTVAAGSMARLLGSFIPLLFTLTTVVGMQELPLLRANDPIQNSLKGGESHRYRLQATANSLVSVVVNQQGVDVAVIALDNKRSWIARSEDSFGRVGPQVLEFAAETEGEFLIEVKARPEEAGGTYEIKFTGQRPLLPADRPRLAGNRHVSLGNLHRSRASVESQVTALAEYEKARDLFKQINDKSGLAMSLQYIGRIHEAQSDYQRALAFYSQALALWREVGNRGGEGYTLKGVGEMHLYLGQIDLALPFFRQAIAIHQEVGNKEGEALGNQEIANIEFQKGNVPVALEHYARAEALYREVGTKNLLAYLLSNMGGAYRDLGDLTRAAAYQNQALEIWRGLNQKHGLATGLTMLAGVFAQQGEMRRALSYYQEAVPLCKAYGEQDCEARAYAQMASVFDQLSETQSALDYYAKAAAIYRNKGQTVGLARMLNSAGALYSSLGEKDRARDFHQQALELSRKAQSRLDEANTLSNLAELVSDSGDTRRARALYQQAMAISREIRNRQGEAMNLNRLGLLAYAGGDKQSAFNLFTQALKINEELGARPSTAFTLNNLGVVHEGLGDSAAALDYFNRALTVFREIENRSGEALTLYRIASVQKKSGQTDAGRRTIAGALRIVETLRGKIANTDLRSSYFATVQEYYDLYVDLLMRDQPDADTSFAALQISEQARARSLLDLLQEAKADARQFGDGKLLARERELIELINGKAAQQQQAFSDRRKSDLARVLGEEINRLTAEYETLEAGIRESNPRYAELVRVTPLTLPDVQRSLDPQTVLLEYKLGQAKSYLWAITPDRFESFALPARPEIEAAALDFYRALTERNRVLKNEQPQQRQIRIRNADRELQTLAGRLREMLLGPLATAGRDKRLVMVADGALQYVPLATLLNQTDADTSEVVTLPSIAVLAQLRRERTGRAAPSKSVAVFADPVFEADDPRIPPAWRKRVARQTNTALAQSQGDFDFGPSVGLPRLLASREEAKSIISFAPAGSSFAAFDFDATRDRALNADLGQYRVLHFATHALVNTSRPQLSGVVLSLYDQKGKERDGFLRLNQIYNLSTSSDLVVLSACSTALGKDVKGEGLIGLTRGFMYAGVPRVIASLWKVDDEATAELMKIFYRNLLQKGLRASQALRAAQVEMQAQARWQSPYYWAGFVLQGDWR